MRSELRFDRIRLLALLAILSAVVLVGLSVPANADELYGRIRGIVTDPTGAVIPGVQLRLTNADTGIVKELTSGTDGSFTFVDLNPGSYNLVATKASFKLFDVKRIQVIQNQIYVQNVAMQMGAASESIEVVANPVQVESTSIQLGATLSGEQVRDLPSLNRNWITLQQTLPGVVAPDTRFGNNYATNGSQAQQNSYLVNGNDANDLPLNSPLTQPNPDAIAEVQMITNTINPEFGRNSGAIMNATTKSGTNRLHGSAFEFYRDTFLNTKNYFQHTASIFHQNQYGGTIGGPVWKNKIFFFYALQLTRARTPETNNGIVAVGTTPVFTSDQLAGTWDESGNGSSLSSNPIPSTLLSSMPAGCQAPGTTWKGCFPANGAGVATVPTASYNTLAAALTKQFVPAANFGGNEFTFNPVNKQKINQHIGRMDVTLSQKDTIWFNAIANNQSNVEDIPFSGSTLPGFGDESTPVTKQFTASWQHTLSTNTINEFRLGYTRLNFPSGQPQNPRQPADNGFPTIIPQLASGADLPQMAITGYFTLGGTNNGPQPRKDQTYQVTDNFSWVKGRHAIKFGYDGRKFQVWNPFANNNDGTYSFSSSGTFSTGDAGLDFLLGVPASYAQGAGAIIYAQSYEHYFYFQDQWRVKDNLTLTLGTGYQIDLPIAEYQYNGISRVCVQPGVQSGVFPTAPLGYTLPGDPGCNKYGGPTTKLNHIGPRVGFAWSPNFNNRLVGGPGKTSVRGGFGLYFNRSEEELNLQDLGIPPFGLNSIGAPTGNPSFVDPFTDINGGGSVATPFPYVPPAAGDKSIDFSQFPPPIVGSVNDRKLTAPHAFNWNFTVQRELPGRTILSVGYVGSHGSGLITSRTENPTTPAGVTACLADPTCIANKLNQPLLFPDHYALDGSIWGNFGFQSNGGWSNYDALQITANKHMGHGLEFQSAYTWSHSLDVSSSFEDTSFQASGGVNSYGHYSRDYGSSAFDARHRWVVTFVYDVPNIAKSWGPGLSRAFDGWSFTGINVFQSGNPINFQDSNSLSLECSLNFTFYACADRPDIVSRPTKLDPRSAVFGIKKNYWFNPASFTNNALGTEGDTPRGYFTGPGLWDTDFTIRKTTKITESSSFSMQMDVFNIFNHTNFANPSGNEASSNVGRITAIRFQTNSRIIQLGAKFIF